MIQAAKLVMIDPDGKYLLLHRSDHPTFGVDPDLPGGTVEDGESLQEAMLREVVEEAGVQVEAASVKEVYSGTDYSGHGTHYALFVVNVPSRPPVTLSWEHSSYEWLSKAAFLAKAQRANDTYMHMVYDVVRSLD